MLKAKTHLSMTNLINDCVVMIQQAGQIVQQAHLESAFTPKGTEARASNIAQADRSIRQTYLHNLSQLFPGVKIICQGERPVATP